MNRGGARELGVLLHISSLPGPYGIGTMGKEAYRFVDLLHENNIKYWQILPLVQTGYGDSPYQSVYSGSGNPYFIDPEILCERKLLKKSELAGCRYNGKEVDYGFLYRNKYPLLRCAFSRFDVSDPAFVSFEKQGEFRYYALYMSLKERFGGTAFSEWDGKYKFAHMRSLAKFERENQREYQFWLFVQYEFMRQWKALKRYANERGVRIIGDLPLYVAYDSADVWQYPRLFKLDSARRMVKVAGVPPDYFSKSGQLWGNPVYRWKEHEKEGYSWWIGRFRRAFALYDAVRLDHFRGFDRYYEIDAAASTAERGVWKDGPKFSLFKEAKKELGTPFFIAEDLGAVDEGVLRLLEETGFPRMKVIGFAFDGDPDNPHLPKNIPYNSVCYTGTHDNDTLYGYVKSLRGKQLRVFTESLKNALADASLTIALSGKKSMAEAMLALVLKSRAKIAVVPMQDVLLDDERSRMNTPSTKEGNWKYRLQKLPDNERFAKYLGKYRN